MWFLQQLSVCRNLYLLFFCWFFMPDTRCQTHAISSTLAPNGATMPPSSAPSAVMNPPAWQPPLSREHAAAAADRTAHLLDCSLVGALLVENTQQ